jgi:predicted PurR-regulated permease PerM
MPDDAPPSRAAPIRPVQAGRAAERPGVGAPSGARDGTVPVPVPATPSPSPTLTGVAAAAVTVAALYFGRDILMPLALGVLLAFALAPVASRLRRWRLGRVGSVATTVALAVLALAAVTTVIAVQAIDLAENLPRYEANLRAKIRDVRAAAPGTGLLERTTEVLRGLQEEMAATEETRDTPLGPVARPSGEGREEEPDPVPVAVVAPDASALDVLRDVGGPLVQPLGTAGLVLVFVVFILLQREDLRDRVIRLAGAADLMRTTEALDDAANRLGRYLLTQLAYNAAYAVPIGLGLWLIGVPNAALWALLGAALRFVPYLGPAIAMAFPTLLAVAADPGWAMPVMTVLLFAVLELISNNAVEPWIYGRSTGLSAFAVVLAAIFWTSLWGPAGLLLATPLTVCLVVLGRHVPQLAFLNVVLGDAPVLPPEARIYQRLIARDPADAVLLAEEAAEEGEAGAVAEELLLPALRLAERDRARGALGDAGSAAVLEGVHAIVDDLAEPAEPVGDGRVLCVAGRNDLDEAAAVLAADAVRRAGGRADVVPCAAVKTRRLPALDATGVRAVVLSYLDPAATRHAGRLAERLRRRLGPEVPVVAGMWGLLGEDAAVPGADATATRLADAAALALGTGGTAEAARRPED